MVFMFAECCRDLKAERHGVTMRLLELGLVLTKNSVATFAFTK